MVDQILLTKEGHEKIIQEHEELVSVKRAEVAERIKEAISYGDISENSEYDSAKNEQAELEERISKLENMLRRAKIIDENEVPRDIVSVGVKVKVKNIATKEDASYIIVGSTEADPFEGKISNESSVGAALIGKRVGDQVEVHVPDGVVNYKVLEISR